MYILSLLFDYFLKDYTIEFPVHHTTRSIFWLFDYSMVFNLSVPHISSHTTATSELTSVSMYSYSTAVIIMYIYHIIYCWI